MPKGKRLHIYIPEELNRKLEQLKKRGKITNKSKFAEKAIRETIYNTIKIENGTLQKIQENKKPTETPEQYIKKLIQGENNE